MHISIEKGKTLIVRLMAVGPVVEGQAQRDVWFEVNGEVRAVAVEDKNSAVETVSREKATNEPGSVGAPMSGVVIEVRVKEGQEIKKGDPVCGAYLIPLENLCIADCSSSIYSPQRHEGEDPVCSYSCNPSDRLDRWSPPLRRLYLATSSVLWCTKVGFFQL